MRKLRWGKWKDVSEEIYQEGYVEGYNDASKGFLENLVFDGECFKMSIKNHIKRLKK